MDNDVDAAKAPVNEKVSDGTAPVGGLLVQVLEASMAQTQHTTDWVMDSLRKECTELAATLAVVREEVTQLLSQPYLPHPDYILAALHPDSYRVQEYQATLYTKHWSHGNGQQ